MEQIETDLTGQQLLNEPLYNKGSAFTRKEREEFNLDGLLPYHVSSIEEQVYRRYQNFLEQPSQLSKFIFLSSLQNRNEVLFYRLTYEHITEMLPYIYTPTVGDVSLHYSALYKEHRGLYLSFPEKENMERALRQYSDKKIDVIVVTDGERILGLGDVGIGGMAIPVGKLALYTLFGGIHPSRTLPIFLDVGTNNQEHLNDPNYLGWRHERILGKEYDEFIDQFVQTVKKIFPGVLLQWEDFAKIHAKPLLERYKDQILSFNDDIQGTAAVVLSAILGASKLGGTKIKDQNIAVFGGGSAGLGISDTLVHAMREEGLTEEEARSHFYLIDREGLLHNKMACDQQQMRFAQDIKRIEKWECKDINAISLFEVIRNAKPTVLIGVSAQTGAFSDEIIQAMSTYCPRPVILPLSNPNSKCEAKPADLIRISKGRAIIATGSPFPSVDYEGSLYNIAQCNNAYIFPGVGLGVIAAKASKVTERMFVAAAYKLSDHSPMLNDPTAGLFPRLEDLRFISKDIALSVGKIAMEEGIAGVKSYQELIEAVNQSMWTPHYPALTRSKQI